MWQKNPIFTALLLLLFESLLWASEVIGSPFPQESAGFSGSVFVEQQTDCMAISDIRSALESVLERREESKYMIVTVVVSPTVEGYLSVLRVIERETGEILLEKTLSISEEECTDAHLVLKVMLEQFLTGFPIEKWKEKNAEKQVQAPLPAESVVQSPKVIVPLQWLFVLGIDSRWPRPSGDIELGLGIDAGARRHGVVSQIVFRAGWPERLEEGRYLESCLLLALGWRFSPSPTFIFQAEARTGPLRVSGIGYDKNYHHWLIMLEAQLSMLWRLGPLYIGPEAAVSPLLHTVHTTSGKKKDLPWIRAGILFRVPLGRSDLK
jgi:hypothetical protein